MLTIYYRIMATYFSDLHCHTTQFTYNRLFPNPWHEPYNIIYPAQGDYAQLARGNVRVVMASLYPVEQGFVTVRPLDLGTDDVTDFLAKVIYNMPKERADEIQSYDHEYYEDLLSELDFLHKAEDPITKKVFISPIKRKKFRYKIVRDFNDLKSLLNLDADLKPDPARDDTIAVVLTIEGASALGSGQKNTANMDLNNLKNKVLGNIEKLKRLAPPGGLEGDWCPFFISLCHHFWNQLGGHAVSFMHVIRKVLDQTEGINTDITDLGKEVIDKLLDNSNGQRRILIDVVHMSSKVRQWFYPYMKQKWSDVPIIASHTGLNRSLDLDKAERRMQDAEGITVHDKSDWLYDNSDEFNPWDLFLSDQEILDICNSGGLIGLNMDEKRMMGRKTLERTKKEARFKSAKAKRAIWIQPLINEILHIARHLKDSNVDPDIIWDNICIGSDFNGMITPIKAFKTAAKFPELGETLFEELTKMVPTEPLLENYNIQDITDKIMWKNNLAFLEKHFHV